MSLSNKYNNNTGTYKKAGITVPVIQGLTENILLSIWALFILENAKLQLLSSSKFKHLPMCTDQSHYERFIVENKI